MSRIIYDVTAKCPTGFKRGKQHRIYHASIHEQESFTIFDFEESYRDMIRKGFLIQEGFTLIIPEGVYLVLNEWHETQKEVHPNHVHCKAMRISEAAA